MRSFKQLVTSLSGSFQGMWFKLWDLIPDRCKRMCVLVSVYARLEDFKDDDMQELSLINERFKLTRDVNALRFPVVLAPWLWKDTLDASKIDPQAKELYIEKLVSLTPCWLKYGDDANQKLKEDLGKLLDICMAKHGYA